MKKELNFSYFVEEKHVISKCGFYSLLFLCKFSFLQKVKNMITKRKNAFAKLIRILDIIEEIISELEDIQ